MTPGRAAFTRLGRFNPDEAGCALWWSGSGVRTRFDGRRLEAEFTVADDEHTPLAGGDRGRRAGGPVPAAARHPPL